MANQAAEIQKISLEFEQESDLREYIVAAQQTGLPVQVKPSLGTRRDIFVVLQAFSAERYILRLVTTTTIKTNGTIEGSINQYTPAAKATTGGKHILKILENLYV